MKRFEVGSVYKSGNCRYVCVDRYEKRDETIVCMMEIGEYECGVKDFDEDINSIISCRKSGFGYADEFVVRECEEFELADEDDVVEELEHPDIDEGEEPPEITVKDFQFRADKKCGSVPLGCSLTFDDKNKNRENSRKKKDKPSALAGIVLIGIIYMVLKSLGVLP